MRFNEAWFNKHLNGMGQTVLWRRSYSCPCINPSSSASDPTCPNCRGKGHTFDAPIEAVVAPASQKTQSEWAKLGLWVDGDIVVTLPASSTMYADAGDGDRVTMLNATDKFNVILTHGAPSEVLLFKPVQIDRVFWRHPQTKALIDGGIPVVSDTGQLTWTAGEPPLGASYSMSGRRYSEYHLFNGFPSNRNMHHGAKLPKRVVMRKYDLAQR